MTTPMLHITRGEFAHSTPVRDFTIAEHTVITMACDIAVFDDGEDDFILRPKYPTSHFDVFRFEVQSDDGEFHLTFYAFDTIHAAQIADTVTAHHHINNWTLYDEEHEHIKEAA
ncbi:hypothetical protein [Vreelandella massiliensis]|uniref:hypothetical protein n=1 Tax=Vreelandella massiliensis TaxID=1816686 RepID=UPI00096A2403|nr:hypothetical protein [Halomonas massiliensis]